MAKADYEMRQQALSLAIAAGGTGSTALVLATSFLAFLNGDTGSTQANPTSTGTQTATQAADASGQASGGATGSTAPDTTADPTQAAGAAAQDAASQSAAGSASDVYNGDVTTLQAKCRALAGRDGGPALVQQFSAFGANSWSKVPPEKYPELYANLVAAGV